MAPVMSRIACWFVVRLYRLQMWTAPLLSGLQQTSNQIACYQMSGLFARREFAGPDGVRYARSKHIGDLARASVIFGITRVSTDWFFHLVRPARLVRLSGDHRSSEA